MELDLIQHLDDADKVQFIALERMFASDGWRLIETWAEQQRLAAEQRLRDARNWDEHRLFTGARLAFLEVENLREATEQQYTMLAESRKAQQVSNDEVEFE